MRWKGLPLARASGGGGGRPTRQAMEDLLFRDPRLQVGPKIARSFESGEQGLVPEAPALSGEPPDLYAVLEGAKKKRRSVSPEVQEAMSNLASRALPQKIPRGQALPSLEELMSLIGR